MNFHDCIKKCALFQIYFRVSGMLWNCGAKYKKYFVKMSHQASECLPFYVSLVYYALFPPSHVYKNKHMTGMIVQIYTIVGLVVQIFSLCDDFSFPLLVSWIKVISEIKMMRFDFVEWPKRTTLLNDQYLTSNKPNYRECYCQTESVVLGSEREGGGCKSHDSTTKDASVQTKVTLSAEHR